MGAGALVVIDYPRTQTVADTPKRRPTQPATYKQLGLRVSEDMNARLEDTAAGLGLDVSSLIRMVLTENLPRYERRVAAVRAGEASDQCPELDPASPP